MFTGPIEDRLAIRELHETYADAVVRADPDAWGAVWIEDAHWDLMGTRTEGREAIVAFWKQAMAGLEAVSFSCTPASIRIDGKRATGRCQTQEIMLDRHGATRMVGGLYEDEMVKTDSGWRYVKRAFRIVAEYAPAGGREGG